MPIGPFEGRLLRLLAENRSPDSYVGGATVLHLNPNSPRTSQDIDVFHDTASAVAVSAERDLATLTARGFETEVLTRQPQYWRARIADGEFQTKLEWVQDSAFRFFPVERDVEFGWRLDFWDAATNKALALAGREKLRDKLDILYLHRAHLHFGALAWAAAGKDAGLTPEMIVEFSARFSRLPADEQEWRSVGMAVPEEIPAVKRQFVEMIEAARGLVSSLPPAEIGCLYLDPKTLRPVCPDAREPEFSSLLRHFGRLGGAWPTVAE